MRPSEKGVMALPSIIVISVLVLVAGLGIASSGFFEAIMGSGSSDANKALAVAEAGAEDALERVVRNKTCNEVSPTCASYTLTVGEGTASVTVSGSGSKTILSQGTVGAKKRTIQVTVSFDANDKATATGWQEI